ncbi:multidrug resistance-associated protein 1-like [Paramacrobiotus metropolitanus]|uniref:multidrug resistance-associated protein 1-like n=1 Tax=Paramacrobiotus metropolitanus TaxID=2943436 RepID=UPI002445EDF7|nr:multidrug resistance-associated protein 1-like [Paramacrobiotus metropolitanus]
MSTDSQSEFPEGFCHDKFWDANATWYTKTPELTQCFQDTILVWIPCAFLFLFLPAHVVKYCQSRLRITRWTWLSLFKTVLCGVLFILALLEFSHLLNKWNHDQASVAHAALVACSLKMIAMIVAILCISMHKYRGQISSLVLFLFWLFLSICEGLRFWSEIDANWNKANADDFILTIHLGWLPLSLAQLILSSIADNFSERLQHGPNPNPAGTASWPNRLVFWWFNHIAYSGWKRPLVQEDMYDPLPDNRAHVNAVLLQNNWTEEMVKMYKSPKSSNGKNTYTYKPSVWKALFKTFWKPFFTTVLLRLGTDISIFVTPQLLSLLITFVQNKDIEPWKGYVFAAALFSSTFCQAIFNNNYMHVAFRTGMRVEAALITTIYRKALTITSAVKQQSSVGEIVNLMSVDALRFYDFMSFVHFLWSAPLQVILAMYYLYNLFGAAAFAGLGAIILTFPINAFAFSKMRQIQNVQMKEKDKRIKLMNEILNGIKVLKLYAWEEPFEKLILSIRNIELSMLKRAALFGALSYVVFVMTPFTVTISTFATYLMTSEEGSFGPDKVFVAISLINILRQPLAIVSPAVTTAVQAKIAAKRLSKFLRSDELDLTEVEELPSADPNAVVIRDGNFKWSKDDPIVLRNVSIAVPERKLVAVVGQVGAGKSSLCSAIIGLMEKASGSVARKGHLAYVPQQAWIQNLTVKENILFGKEMNEGRYQEVIRACALTPDLESFSAGDETEIGERGANLSGGQRQRISLARAVYSDADVIILDDPLSAVDAHVGKHIFENVIGPNGLLKNKTRILVTHGIGYLPQTDHIFVLANHTVSESGTYQQLLRNRGDFAEFLRTYLTEEDDEEETAQRDPETVSRKEQLLEELGEKRSRSDSNVDARRSSTASSLKRVRSVLRQASKVSKKERETEKKAQPEPITGKLVEAEKAEIGGVKWTVYLTFIKHLSYRTAFMILIFYGGYSAIGAAASFWLSDWSRLQNSDRKETDYRLGVYGALGCGQLVLIICHTLTMAYGRVRAGRYLHEGLLRRIMRAPMSFFDTTPLGRLVNRFSKDVDTVDVLIPSNSDLWLYFIFGTLSVIVVICVTAWVFIIILIPLVILYFFLQRFYIVTSTQLKRLQSVSRSPIFSNFQESLSGTGVIIATKQTERFIRANERLMDNNDMCFYLSLVSQRWIAVRLELIGVLITVSAALYAVAGRDLSWGMEPSQAGLSIGYSLSVTGLLAGVLWITSELESNIVAVERIKEYSEAPQEAAWVVPSSRPQGDWPPEGRVDFKDYQTRYRPGLDLVLKGVTARIASGEKIGIVGRTGAGKSSMTLALFRIIEAASGSIDIDNLNIADIGLHDVRSRITILPQEPVLFSGTLRMNLDPFTKYTDAEIWDALEHSHLKQFVSTLPEGLHHLVVDGGENYSVGQRQLICLARALLRKTKILVLDEATAAIDLQTDDLIQHTIRDKFAECTVLTIAHRINTIMDSTRIMVLDQGRIKEFGPPQELLKDHNSIFYGLAKTANLV